MKVLEEITSDWQVEYTTPNHTYLFDDTGRLVAYKPWHTGLARWLTRPSARFDRKHRKFRTLPYKEAEWPCPQ